MKLLTATALTQGLRDNDFSWTVPGELVWVNPVICCSDAADPDGPCGCGRAFAGLNSHRATTTAEVRDVPVSRSEVVMALESHLETGGYQVDRSAVREITDWLIAAAGSFPLGTVIQRRLDHIEVRPSTPA